MSLIDELKRRNVFKVTGAYLALGWMIVEMSGTAVPALQLPDWTTSLLLWIGLAGLPFVIAFAWVFELTPEGVKRASEIDPSQSIAQHIGRRLDYVIIAMLGIAMMMFAADHFIPRSGTSEESRAEARPTGDSDPVTPAVGPAAARQAEPDSGPSVGRASARQEPGLAPDDKSIAVLPFVNMSSNKEQEYFSDGMSEELLNLLAKAPDLKVIARTSSFAFKGTNTPIAEIARQLNVAHVLEGSVRRSGNTVRITAQLIRTADSTHLWSETYDRPMDDIFKVQDEIAGAIAGALQIRIKGGTLSREKGGTTNLEAYDLYLRADRAIDTNTKASLDSAEQYLRRAIELDPQHGIAWAALSNIVQVRTENGLIDPRKGFSSARDFAQRALVISPDNVYAHSQLQYVLYVHDWNWNAAESASQRVLEIDPNYAIGLNRAAMLSRTLGKWRSAERFHREALVRDPLDPSARWNLGLLYYLSGKVEDAEREYKRLVEQAPDFPWTRIYLGKALLAQGKPEEALATVLQDPDTEYRLLLLPVFFYAAGRHAEADEASHAQIARWADTGAYYVAQTFAYRGNADRAMEWLERSYQQKDVALVEIVGESLFSSLAGDPRFKAFLRKMNLPETPPG